MQKHCNIYPQVFNSTRYVDSELFKSILKSTNDRTITKRVYDTFNSTEFKKIFGDWSLYQAVKFNKLTDEQNATFQTIYNGDLKQLEDTLDLNNLNELYEPNYDLTENKSKKGTITFKSKEELTILAKNLNKSFEDLLNYITSTKESIFFQLENEYINQSTAPVKRGGALGVLYGLDTIADVNSKTSNLRLLNSEILTTEYDNGELHFINNLISGQLVNNITEFREFVSSNKVKKLNTYLQVERINKYISNKIEALKNSIIETIDNRIKLEPEKTEYYEDKKQYFNEIYTNLISEFNKVDDKGNRSFLYRSLLSHLNRYYKINISLTNDIAIVDTLDADGNSFGQELNLAEHMTRGAMKIDKVNSVAQELKQLISISIINSTFSNLDSHLNLTSKYGVNEMLTIEDIWSTLISVTSESRGNLPSIIKLLRELNTIRYNGLLTTFIDTLETDENIQNSFISSVNLSVVPNQAVVLNTSSSGNNTDIRFKQNNYGAFINNLAYEDVLTILQVQFENNKSYVENVNSGLKQTLKESLVDVMANNPEAWMYNQLQKLGLSSKINKQDFERYILSELNIDFRELNNFNKIIKDIKYAPEYFRLRDKFIEDLIRISLELKRLQSIKSKNKNKFKFRKSFTQSKTLKQISKFGTLNYYGFANHSYLNVNKDMEYSPQFHSYLTKLFEAITPIDNEVDLDYAKEVLSDFINDPLLYKNPFLYNVTGFGTGLFNVEYKNNVPHIKSINPDFKNVFEQFQLDGTINQISNMGYKYDEITGNGWNILSSVYALTGRYIIPSSDSPRSYGIKMAKYGLKDFVFDENGKYVPLYQISQELGILKDGKQRTAKDINDDSKVYIEFENKLTKEVDFEIKTYGQLKKEIEDVSKIRNEAKDLLRILIAGYKVNVKDKNLISPFLESKELKQLVESEFKQGELDDYLKAIRFVLGKVSIDRNISIHNPNFIKDALVANNLKIESNEIDSINFYIFIANQSLDGRSTKQRISRFKKLYSNHLNISKLLNVDNILKSDSELINRISNFRTSQTVKALVQTVWDEAEAMRIATSKMFNIIYDNKDVNNGTVRKVSRFEPTEYAKLNSTTDNKLLHHVRDFKKQLLDKDIPTGEIFKFHRLSFKQGDKRITLNDYAKNFLGKSTYSQLDLIELVSRTSPETHPLKNELSYDNLTTEVSIAKQTLNNIIYNFIDEVLKNQQIEQINAAESYKDELLKMTVEAPSYVKGTHGNVNTENADASKKYKVKLISTHIKIEDDVIDDSVIDSELDSENNEDLDRDTVKSELENMVVEAQYNRAMLEMYVNDYIFTTTFGEDILYGRPYEYKDALDVNKRVSQIFKNGKSNNSKRLFSSVTLGDIEIISNMLDDLSNTDNLNKNIIHKRYLKELEVGNGLSMITVDEYIKRLKSLNQYEGKLKDYIEALTDENIPFDYKKYDFVTEQLKYFLYARQTETNGVLAGSVTSYQEKNSTIVLFPKLYKNTDFGLIIDWMNKHKVDSVNFLSGAKVGGQPVFYLHETQKENITNAYNGETKSYGITYSLKKTVDENGQIIIDDRIDRNQPLSEENTINVNNFKIYHKESSIRVQQETVGHLLDEDGVLSTQLIKAILQNLIETDIYTLGVDDYIKSYNGKGTNDKVGIFELFQQSLSYNAEHSRDLLLSKWGAIKDGKIQFRADGSINIDINEVRKSIQESATQNGDLNLMKALEALDESGEPLLDFNFPTISKSIEQSLQAKITRLITRQKLKQIHAPIAPDLFLTPAKSFNKSKGEILDSSIIEEYTKKGYINYTSDFLEQCNVEGSISLKSEHTIIKDGKKVKKPAQIVLNLWDSKLDIYRKSRIVNKNGKDVKEYYVDIDSIPKDALRMIGTRIPHEGMQSAVVLEVVGIMNTNASQIIVPMHLAAQTGWDFDIDTLYVYPRNLYIRNDNVHAISMQYDEVFPETAFDTIYNQKLNYFKTYYSNIYDKLQVEKQVKTYAARNNFKTKYLNKVNETRNDIKLKFQNIAKAIKERNTGTLSNDEFNILVAKVLSLSENDVTPDVLTLQRYFKQLTSSEAQLDFNNYVDTLDSAISDLIEKSDKIGSYKEILNSDADTILDRYFKYTPEFKESTSYLKEELESELKLIQEEYLDKLNEYLSDSNLITEFNKLPKLKRASREVRDNLIIDIIEARLLHENSNIHRTKPNEFETLFSTSKYINKGLGNDNSLLNFTSINDRNTVRNMNINVRVLKGISVSLDNLFRIFGTVKGGVGKSVAMPIMVTREEFGGKSYDEIINTLNSTIGYGNYKETTKGFLIFNTQFGNNRSGDWKNILGDFISEQSSEITSNILDAVKFNLGMNIDLTTAPILSLFAYSPISHYTNIGGEFKNNSFAYSNLLIHQPVISKFLKQIDKNTRNSEYADKNNAMRIVSNDLYSHIIMLLNKIDVSTGQIKDIDNTNSILDVFLNYLVTSGEFENVEKARNKVREWKSNIAKNKEFKLYASNDVDVYKLYQEFINMLKEDKLESAIEEFLIKTYGNNKAKELIVNLKDSTLIKTLNSLNFYRPNSDGLFKVEKGEYQIYDGTNFKPISKLDDSYNANVFKTINELNEEFVKGNENNYKDLDSAFNKIYEQNDINKSIEFINYLNTQLEIFKLYEHYDKTLSTISKAQLVLKTEKLGTSPNSTVSEKLFDDLSEMYLDSKTFEKQMSSLEEFTISDINTFRKQYWKQNSIEGKLHVMKTYINKSSEKLKLPKTELYANGIQMAEAIFPNYISDTELKNYDVTRSIYPYLESQLYQSNIFSTKVFSDVLLSEKPNVRKLITSVMSELGVDRLSQSKKSEIADRIKTVLVNDHVFDTVPFFNGNLNNDLRHLEILRVVGEVIIERKFEKKTDRLGNEYELPVDIVSDSNIHLENVPSIEDYQNLSAANQIHILKEHLNNIQNNNSNYGVNKISNIEEVREFLGMFDAAITKDELSSNGYHKIWLRDSGKNLVRMQSIFTKMYFNDNAYIRQTARDLIRYSFFTSGLKFGMNIAKFVDLSFYYKNFSDYDKIGESDNNRLYKYNESLKQLKNDSDIEFDSDKVEYITNLVRKQLFEDNAITPKIVRDKKPNSPTFTTPLEGHKILIEESEKVKNSKWDKYNSIKTTAPQFGFSGLVGFKKYVVENSPYIYYYPFVRTLNFELGKSPNGTIVNKFKEGIESEEYYINIILEYANSNSINKPSISNSELLYDEYSESYLTSTFGKPKEGEYGYINKISKSNESYTNTAKRLISNSDVVLYVGNNKFYKEAFNSEKTLFTNLEEFDFNILSEVDFTNPINLTIVGDTLDSNYTQQQYDKTLYKYVSMLSKLANINILRSIHKDGVGEAVFKASQSKAIKTEYVEIGTKNTIKSIEQNNELLVEEFDTTSAEINIQKLINKETSDAQMLYRLYTHSKNINEIPSSELKVNINQLREHIKNMSSTENRFKAIKELLAVNASKIESIIKIISYDTIDLPNGISHTLLDINVFNYMKGDDTKTKIILSRKLLNYYNLIKTAKILLEVGELQELNYSAERQAEFTEEELNEYLKLQKEIQNINAAIKSLKNSESITDKKVYKDKETVLEVVNFLEGKVNTAIANYFVSFVVKYSRNQKFKNTKFNKLVQNIKDGKPTEDITITSKELAELYHELLKYNNDITSTALYLDSVRDVSSLSDNTFTLLTELKLVNKREQENKLNELFGEKSILSKYKSLIKDDSKKYSKSRSNTFKKYINPDTNKFYDEYNWDEYYKDVARYNLSNQRYKGLLGFLDNKDSVRFETSSFWLSSGERIDNFNDEIKMSKLNSNLNKLESYKSKTLNNFKNVNSVTPINKNTTLIKVGTLKYGEVDIETYLELDEEGFKPNNKSLESRLLFKIDGEYISSKTIKSLKSKSSSSESSSKFGTIDSFEQSSEEYKYHLKNYDERGLSFNDYERELYERKYHIKFEDNSVESLERSKNRKEAKRKKEENPDYVFKDARNLNDLKIYKVIPDDKYLSEKYKTFTQLEKEMLKDIQQYLDDIVREVFPTKYLDDSFVPYIFITQQLSLKDSLLKFIGWREIQKENTTYDIFGEKPVYYFKAHSLDIPNVKKVIRYEEKKPTESIFEFELRVVKEANEKLAKLKQRYKEFNEVPEFKKIEEVYDFNKEILSSYVKSNSDSINYDMISVLKTLTEELYDIKVKSEFANTYQLLMNVVGHDTFEARAENAKGSNIINMAYKKITGNVDYVTKKGKETNIYKSLDASNKKLHDVSRINTKFDQIINATLRYTSMNVMWFNYHTGVKNVMKGVSDMFIEYYGGEFANRKEFGKGMNEYKNSLPSIVTALMNDKVTSKTSAIIKEYSHIYADHSERKLEKETGGVGSKFVNWSEMGGYMFMTGGEHFIQFTTLLTLMKSHRIVNGFAMTVNEYISNKKYEIAKQYLSKEEFKKLEEYVNLENNVTENKYRFRDYTAIWLERNSYRLDKDNPGIIKKINDEIIKNKKEQIEEFSKYETLDSQYKFEDGKLNKSDKITLDIEAKFLDRVQALNQSMHGIYNTLDRNLIQNTMSGEIIFQFRKWMRPVWIRYMGDRYTPFSNKDKSTFSERLGKHRSGIFADFGRFMRSPIVSAMYNSKQHPELNAVVNMFSIYAHFFKNISYYYNIQSPTQQANIRKTLMFGNTLLGLTALVTVAGLGYDDDDDMPKWRDWLLYNLSGVQTEHLETLPYYGWYVFYKRTKQNVVPVEKQLDNLAKLMYDTAAYPFREEDERIYQRGQYTGESKISVDVAKAIPIYRQIHKELYLSSSINYYGMFNPLTNLFR